ncbi:hypothetical protein MOSE0_H07096 [Monosporozyma servazzii]
MSLEMVPVTWQDPTVVVGSQVVAAIITMTAIQYQKRYNRLHRSIYGLSYDTQWFQFVYHVLSVYCSLNYMFNPIVKGQLQRRYPLFYGGYTDNSTYTERIPISWVMVVCDILMAVNIWTLIRQLREYGYTKHIHQGVSTLAKLIIIFFVLILGIVSLWFAYWFGIHQRKDSGLLGIFLLDHVNYMWMLLQILHIWSFWPQICINWEGKCCQGLSSKFVILSIISSLIKLVGIMVLKRCDDQISYYHWPFNLEGKIVIIMEYCALFGLLLQAQYFYPSNKPYLPRQTEKRLSYNHAYSFV